MKIILHFKTLIFLFVFTILINSCVQPIKYIVDIDSIGSDLTIRNKKYILMPTMENVKEADLRYLEFANKIHYALSKRKYIKVDSIDKADIVIFLTYGIGNPQEHHYSYSIPIWGQTGVSSSSTSGNIYVFGNSATYTANTTYTPTYGIVGANTYQGKYITYFRFLKLDAFDLHKLRYEGQEHQLWSTIVTSEGTNNDLRLLFPYMVAASQNYFGVNTGRKISIQLYHNDESVYEYINSK